VLEIEERTRHDVVAFIENVAEYVGPSSKYIHMGVTSSDILDTSFSCLLNEAADILIEDIAALMEVLKEKAYACKDMPAIGRTHGIHAEPVTFGLKITQVYDEMKRNLERMRAAKERIRHGKISGAVGTYAHVPPSVEEYVCEKLGLKACPISSQIIPRDYYAEFFTAIALTGSTIERMSMEVRNLQRTEVGEAEEFFRKGQTGSSAMPHKRNPIASENLCGMARLLHGFAVTAMENIPLWHERDISHSSAERVIAPDALASTTCSKGEERLPRTLSSTPRRCRKPRHHPRPLSLERYSIALSGGLTRQEPTRSPSVAHRAATRAPRFRHGTEKGPERQNTVIKEIEKPAPTPLLPPHPKPFSREYTGKDGSKLKFQAQAKATSRASSLGPLLQNSHPGLRLLLSSFFIGT
jgi:adenylosuccinate lyase